MARVTPLDARHEDFVHDVAYDHYGQRLATCASDLTVHVFDWVRRGAEARERERERGLEREGLTA